MCDRTCTPKTGIPMIRIVIVLALALLTQNCKESPKKVQEEAGIPENVMATVTNDFPENVKKIFEAHGGLAAWKTKRTMTFTMPKPTGNETQTIDLNNRKEKIETPNFSMGYNGSDFWLADEQKTYKGDPIFYHNLMFYFYAMPFVLADDGINYSETKDLEYQGKSFPGIRISYEDGVGVSSKDEYFLHFDPASYQMAWLGYTVTYRSGEKSENVKWIRYDNWQDVDGLVLPKSMTWHKIDEGKIMEAASTRNFENVSLNTKENSVEFYAVPENAEIVTRQ